MARCRLPRRLAPTSWLACAAAVLVAAGAPPSAIAAQQITTTYRYNADGALTATVTQMDGQAPATVYNTYDNFLPDGSDPTTGNVRAGDGNVVGIGASPGGSDAGAFAYDQRDRLVDCRVTGAPAVSHTYHANGLLASSTLASGDTLQFYYGVTPTVANMRQPSTAMTSSFLGHVRYLSDGTEQALVGPRKDVAGVYAPEAATFSPYGYEAFGAPRTDPGGLGPEAQSWDLVQNPFQYSGEYRDPACGAYYLRARWYLPAQQVFLSRDPAHQVERYGYTGGNPITRTDPSGMSYATFTHGFGTFMHRLGPGGAALSALPYVGPGLFLLEAAALGEFWHHPSSAATLAYMTIWAGAGLGLELPMIDRAVGSRAAFGGRVAGEGLIGATQAAQAGFQGHRGRFLPKPALESIAATTLSVLAGRFVSGVGYRPKVTGMSPEDVRRMVIDHAGGIGAEKPPVLVFTARYPRRGTLDLSTPLRSAPRDEAVFTFQPISHEGQLHGALAFSQVRAEDLYGGEFLNVYRTGYGSLLDRSGAVRVDERSAYAYIGQFDPDAVRDALVVPSPLKTRAQQLAYFNRHQFFDTAGQSPSNSADHVNAILQRLRSASPAPGPELEGGGEETR